jgi:hypothetical protein
MKITFKIIPESEHNEWVGWFGEDVIKLKLQSGFGRLEDALEHFLYTDLGIHPESMKCISKKDKNMFTYEFPDVAWELFLTIIEK